MSASNADIVLAQLKCYREQDVGACERLLADDFRFTSPQDDRIGKATYLERCFPTADRFIDHRLLELVEVDQETVLIRYEYELVGGSRYRNMEAIAVRDGQISEVQVYFGGSV